MTERKFKERAGENSDPLSESDLLAVLSYVGETTSNAACPMCATRKWVVETETQNGEPSLIAFPGRMLFRSREKDVFGETPTLVLTCDNCGFIREHNIPFILNKIRGAGNVSE
ncbi:hypothetical protein U8Q05_11920 [Rhizobium ruizarguesonis]|nr:hypothetical protein U8Q05_11920 [Rhizobium ruizarguesonis]